MSVRMPHFVALALLLSLATGCCSYPCGGYGCGYNSCVDYGSCTPACGQSCNSGWGGGFWSRLTGGGCCDSCAIPMDGCCGDSCGGGVMMGAPGGCAACQGAAQGAIPAGAMMGGQVYPGPVIQGDVIQGGTFDAAGFGGQAPVMEPTPAVPYGTNLVPTPAPDVGISPPPAGSAAPKAPINAVPAT